MFGKLFSKTRRPFRKVARANRPFRPGLEGLELREVPTVTASFAALTGVLSVLGDNSNNAIVVEYGSSGQLRVTHRLVGSTTAAATVPISNLPAVPMPVQRIEIRGQNGNDNLRVSSSLITQSVLWGGLGNDTVEGGGGPSTLYGEGDNDRLTLTASSGQTTVVGGTGNDRLDVEGTTTQDTMILHKHGVSPNSASVTWVRRLDLVQPGVETRPAPTIREVEDVSFYSDAADDALICYDLTGTGVARVSLQGGSGNDSLDARLSNVGVYLLGSGDDDTIQGSDGNDTILSSTGDDLVFGRGGNDSISGSSDNDFLDGGPGNDTIDGGQGNDVLYGDAGADSLVGGTGADKLVGGGATDTLDDVDATGTTKVTGLDWFESNILDADLRSVARHGHENGSLDRADMLKVFDQARRDDTVSSNEFSDLTDLVLRVDAVFMPDHVRNLTTKTVLGDPANAMFRGAPLGDLAAGSTGYHLNQLVRKWLRGEDRPEARVDGVVFTYASASGTLFRANNAVSYLDVSQGAVGDCYFLASLASAARQDPQMIRNMFIDNGDGTYTVRFFHDGAADYVTVDRMLPATNGGKFVYNLAGRATNDTTNVLWAALAEKAYAQMNASGWIEGWDTGVNSYEAISGGYPEGPMEHISGRDANYWLLGLASVGGPNNIISAFNRGELVTFTTLWPDYPLLVPEHVYTLIDYHTEYIDNGWGGTTVKVWFTVYNPWGPNGANDEDGRYYPGEVLISWDEAVWDFSAWYHA